MTALSMTADALHPQLAWQRNAMSVDDAASARYNRRLCLFVIAIAIFGGAYLVAHRPVFISLYDGLLAMGILWLGLLPTVLYLLDEHSPPLPFLPLVGIFYALTYGFPVFSADRDEIRRLSAEVVNTRSLVLVIAGLLSLYLGYGVIKMLFGDKLTPMRLPRAYSEGWLRTIAWAFLLANVLELAVPWVAALPSVHSILEPGGYLAYGILILLWMQKRLPRIQAILLLGFFIPVELMLRFTTGALLLIVMFALFLQLMFWYHRRRLPIILIIAGVLSFSLLQPVKFIYRTYTWEFGRYANIGILSKAMLFANLTYQYYSGDIPGAKGGSSDSALERIAHIRLLSYVMSQSPSPVPFWGGYTYAPLLTKFIPRLVWADKPTEMRGQDFGHRYSLLAPTDRFTTMNLPWLVELYVNFGMLGVPIGMAIIGCFFAVLTQKLNRRGMTFLEFAVGATILFPLSVDQESNFSLVCGNVLLSSAWLYIFFQIALSFFRPSASASNQGLHGPKAIPVPYIPQYLKPLSPVPGVVNTGEQF